MRRFLLAVAFGSIVLAGDRVAADLAGDVSRDLDRARELRQAGRHAEAVRVAEAAVARARRSGDPTLLEHAVSVLGDCRFYTFDYAGAVAAFTEALALARQRGDAGRQEEIHKSLGISWSAQGRSDLGLAHLHQAAEIAERHLPGGASRSTHANLGSVYQRLGARSLAIRAFRQALAPGPEPLTPEAELDARTRIGSLYLDAGEPAAALPELRAALAAAEGATPVEQAWVLGYLAAAEIDTGDTAAALRSVRREAGLHRRVGYWPLLRLALVRIGDLQPGDPAAARAAYEEAAAIGPEHGRSWLWLPKVRLARLSTKAGDREGALAGYEAAAEALERWVGELDEEERLAALAGHRTLYEEWLAVLLHGRPAPSASELEEALAISERARGALPRGMPARVAREQDDAGVLAQREREGADRLALMRAGSRDPAEIERLELELWRLHRERNGRSRSLPPRLLPALQEQLASSEAVLAYVQFRDAMLLFVITSGRAVALRLPLSDRELTLRVEALLGRLSAGAGDGGQPIASRLYRDLVAEALGQLPQSIRTLTIITDGSLTGLPFEVLLAPAADGRPAQPLLTRYAFTYSESLAHLLDERRGQPPAAAGRLLVLHPGPAATPRPERGSLHALYREEGFTVTPLRHADEEVRAIRAALGPGAQVWRDGNAREGALTREALAGVSAVHFTTHGMVSLWSPWRSALLLAGGEEDGLLQAREIAARFPPCQLVVLAACRTAVGQPRSGRAVRSLAEAFRNAGARTVIASLWDVDDASTARLFAPFYRELAGGTPPAEALRRAKLTLLRDPATASPRHWAGFVVYGNGLAPVQLTPAPARERRGLPSRPFALAILAACGTLAALRWSGAASARRARRR